MWLKRRWISSWRELEPHCQRLVIFLLHNFMVTFCRDPTLSYLKDWALCMDNMNVPSEHGHYLVQWGTRFLNDGMCRPKSSFQNRTLTVQLLISEKGTLTVHFWEHFRPLQCSMTVFLLLPKLPTPWDVNGLSLIHIWRCRRYPLCRSRWSPYH